MNLEMDRPFRKIGRTDAKSWSGLATKKKKRVRGEVHRDLARLAPPELAALLRWLAPADQVRWRAPELYEGARII